MSKSMLAVHISRALLALILVSGVAGVAGVARSQERGPGSALTLTIYLRQVANSNLDILSQRLSLPIAEAQVAVARMFPDPQLIGGISQVDISGQGAPLLSTLGVMVPLEMGGKRGAR